MEIAGLNDLLKQEGSYTIFAPTDDAFEGLTKADFALLKSESSTAMSTCILKAWRCCQGSLFLEETI